MKYLCPFCKQNLNDTDVMNGVCPNCKKLFEPIEVYYSIKEDRYPALDVNTNINEKILQQRKGSNRKIIPISIFSILIFIFIMAFAFHRLDPISGWKVSFWPSFFL